MSRNCCSKVRCLSCQGRHHVAVCDKSSPRAVDPNGDCTSEPMSALNPDAPTNQPPTTNTMWTDKSVLLQTAQATTFNPDHPSKTSKVQIVLDTGSQRSYITENVKNQLTLSTVGKQCMTIATFGATKRDDRICESVRVGLRVKYGQVKVLTLFSVPRNCDPLTPHPLADTKEMYPHLSGQELADDSGDVRELQVDILIGSDYYWQFITGQLQRGTSGPVVIQTCLGWSFLDQFPLQVT